MLNSLPMELVVAILSLLDKEDVVAALGVDQVCRRVHAAMRRGFWSAVLLRVDVCDCRRLGADSDVRGVLLRLNGRETTFRPALLATLKRRGVPSCQIRLLSYIPDNQDFRSKYEHSQGHELLAQIAANVPPVVSIVVKFHGTAIDDTIDRAIADLLKEHAKAIKVVKLRSEPVDAEKKLELLDALSALNVDRLVMDMWSGSAATPVFERQFAHCLTRIQVRHVDISTCWNPSPELMTALSQCSATALRVSLVTMAKLRVMRLQLPNITVFEIVADKPSRY